MLFLLLGNAALFIWSNLRCVFASVCVCVCVCVCASVVYRASDVWIQLGAVCVCMSGGGLYWCFSFCWQTRHSSSGQISGACPPLCACAVACDEGMHTHWTLDMCACIGAFLPDAVATESHRVRKPARVYSRKKEMVRWGAGVEKRARKCWYTRCAELIPFPPLP